MKNILIIPVLFFSIFLFGCEKKQILSKIAKAPQQMENSIDAVPTAKTKEVIIEKESLPPETQQEMFAFNNSVTVEPEKITLEFIPKSKTPTSYNVQYFIQEEDGESVEATTKMNNISTTHPLRVEIEELTEETKYMVGVFILDEQGKQIHSFEDEIITNKKQIILEEEEVPVEKVVSEEVVENEVQKEIVPEEETLEEIVIPADTEEALEETTEPTE
jgi:hypothetical protein